jgi:RsiW-degrading membrane proteinase PrsW (M82 family)
MSAAGRPIDNYTVRGIAIAVVTFACLLHGTWRTAGIVINNVFAVTKVALLLFVIAIGLATLGNAFPQTKPSTDNFASPNVFGTVSTDPYGMAEGFLAIM